MLIMSNRTICKSSEVSELGWCAACRADYTDMLVFFVCFHRDTFSFIALLEIAITLVILSFFISHHQTKTANITPAEHQHVSFASVLACLFSL